MSVMPLALLAFFLFGVLLVLPGALFSEFAAAFQLDLAQSGGLASALMVGIGVGVLGSGPLADRLPRRPLFVAAALACGASLAVAALAANFTQLLLALGGLGAAAGCYETLLNAAVPEAHPPRAAARLSLAHAAATLGAALGAPALEAAGRALGWSRLLALLALGFAGIALCGAATRFPAPAGAATPASAAPALPLGMLAPLALASCAYVGLEAALSTLLPGYAGALGISAARGSLAISGFWAGLFLARIAFARLALPARAREPVLGASLAAALLLALGAAGAVSWLALWSTAIGFALGAVFPVLVVLAGDAAPLRRGTALALVVAFGSLGGGALPWLAGAAGGAFGASALMFTLAAASAASAVGVALWARAVRSS